ncbi:MAG: putative DNA-binding domain-containing protein [Rhodospirillales bacterium]|nr:putative DNA-binding domain-containing protein [Rhodospirillales bacterium]
MTALLELQRQFRDAALREAPVPAEILDGKVPAAARIGVYRNNILGNLTRALRLNFPAVERLVGEGFFAATASRYLTGEPPASADLYEYGQGFADFLAEFGPAAPLPYLADVARLEWAATRALHAPPSAPLDPDSLAVVPTARQPDLVFVPHPTLTLLTVTTPARGIWEAVLIEDAATREAALGAVDPAGPGERLAVLRPTGELVVMALTPVVFDLSRALVAGQPLADALAALPQADAPQALAELLARGFFATAHLPA